MFTLDVCDIENRECDITTNSLYSFSALMRKETGSDRAGKKEKRRTWSVDVVGECDRYARAATMTEVTRHRRPWHKSAH